MTEHAEESTAGWSPERRAALKYAREVRDANDNVIAHFARYKKWDIVEGETADKFVELGIAVALADVVITDSPVGLLTNEVSS